MNKILIRQRNPIKLKLNYHNKTLTIILPRAGCVVDESINGENFRISRFANEIRILSLYSSSIITLTYNNDKNISLSVNLIDHLERNFSNE